MNRFTEIKISDPEYASASRIHMLNALFINLLNDKRDLPFIKLSLKICFITIPAATLLFIPGVFSWWFAVLYFVLNSSFLMGPYILMLHHVCHRALFKRKYMLLNKIIPWILGPFFGVTPETYFAHHIGMHHAENNMDYDVSSTLKMQRDSLKDFMNYFLRFFFWGIPDLYIYLKKRKRKKLLQKLILGEFSYLMMAALLLFINWKASFVVFIFPLFFTRFMMMAGNWGQHAFIDLNEPQNCYRNSITCINSMYNKTCWNDGYHIGHHLYPTLHWTELPGEFKMNLKMYKEEDALIFQKVDFFRVWFLLMTKNYKKLAMLYVQLDNEHLKSQNEIIGLLKSRTMKIS